MYAFFCTYYVNNCTYVEILYLCGKFEQLCKKPCLLYNFFSLVVRKFVNENTSIHFFVTKTNADIAI